MLNALRALVAPRTRASATTRLEVEATRGADAIWTSAQSFEALATEGYQHAVWAFACIRVLTSQVKSYKPLLFRETSGTEENEIERHPLLDLLKRPNDEQSLAQLLAGLYAYELIGGNSYLERVALGPNSRPAELWYKRPDRMKIKTNVTTRVGGYEYKVNEGTHVFQPWEILHLKTFNPLDDWYGMSPLTAAARGVDTFNAGQAHNLAMLQNGARPSGAWISDGPLEDRVRGRIRGELQEAAQIRNRGRSLILEGGISWQELGVTQKDLDFLNGQADAARQIHAAFGVHPVLTGLETGTFENQKQAMRSAVLMTVFPWLDQLTENLNRWLVPVYGDDLRLDYDREAFQAISEDQDSLWERATLGWAKGILTRNESRALIGYDQVKEDDRGEVFVSELYGRTPVSTILPTEGGNTPDPEGVDTPEPESGDTPEPAARARARILPEHGADRTRYRRAIHLKDEAERITYWRSRVDLQERWEVRAAHAARTVFEAERAEIANRATGAGTAADLAVIVATTLANTSRWDALTPVLIAAMVNGGEGVLDRMETEERARARRAAPNLDYNALQAVFGLVFEETIDVALSHMPKLVGDLSAVTLERAAAKIAQGASEGLSVPGIADLLDDLYLEQIIPNRSTVIARTEIIRSTNYGGQQAARGTGLNLTKTWLATRDERTRDAHVTADGQTVPVDSTYEVDGDSLSYPGDPRGRAENVIQCFLGDTLVERGVAEASIRSWYEGDVITITTAGGHKLTGTPNHPILTRRGWVPLGVLREGDQVVERSASRKHTAPQAEVHDVETMSLREVHDALHVTGSPVRTTGVAVDLHGRDPGKDVDVVAARSGLLDDRKPGGPQENREIVLEPTNVRALPFAARDEARGVLGAVSRPSGRSMSGKDLALALTSAHARPLEAFGITTPAHASARTPQDARDGGSTEPVLAAQPRAADAGVVLGEDARGDGGVPPVGGEAVPFGCAFTEVVRHAATKWAGHVYTIQTATGWYVADSIIAANCRCSEYYTEVTS